MIGAIVVAYRDPAAIYDCLESLAEVRHVVVVNVTADASVAERALAHGRQVVDIPANVGYAAGVNEGVRHLPGEVDRVLFANDDIRLVSVLEAWDGAGVSVPRQVSPDGSPLQFLHPLPTPLAFIRHWVLGRPNRGAAAEGVLEDGMAANGAALIASRALLEQHPLPEEYFMYWEETAWFWRLADAGVVFAVDPTAVVIRPPGHLEHSSAKARLLGANLVRLGTERYGRRGTALYLLLGAAWTLRLAVTDITRPDRASRLSLRGHMLRGLLRSTWMRRT